MEYKHKGDDTLVVEKAASEANNLQGRFKKFDLDSIRISPADNGWTVRTGFKRKARNSDSMSKPSEVSEWPEDTNHVYADMEGVKSHLDTCMSCMGKKS